MRSLMISLDDVEKVKSFVSIIADYNYDFDLTQDRYVIDAKSILGVLSLDLSQPLALTIQTNDEIDNLLKDIEPYYTKM